MGITISLDDGRASRTSSLRPWNDHDHSYLDRVDTKILASNAICCDAATKALQKTNMVLPELSGDAAEMGRTLALIAAKTKTPITAVTGGETVVKFDPKVTTGLGGRSQELALSFLAEMQKQNRKKNHGYYWRQGQMDVMALPMLQGHWFIAV